METPTINAAQSSRTAHPLILAAATSVTVLSLAGVGLAAGWLPGPARHADSVLSPSVPAATTAAAAGSASVPPFTLQQTFNLQPEKQAVLPSKTNTPSRPSTTASRTGRSSETASRPMTVRTASKAEAPVSPICTDCGRVEFVREVLIEGKTSGAGAVLGGVLGGLAGNQVGAGSGKDLATLAGIFGGAIAGNHVEKNMKEMKRYDVTVRLDDGRTQIVSSDAQPVWRVGDRVKLRNGELISDSAGNSGGSPDGGTSLVSTLGSID